MAKAQGQNRRQLVLIIACNNTSWIYKIAELIVSSYFGGAIRSLTDAQ